MFRDCHFSVCEPLLSLLSDFVDHLLSVSLIPLTLSLRFFELHLMFGHGPVHLSSYRDEVCLMMIRNHWATQSLVLVHPGSVMPRYGLPRVDWTSS